jgi:hypothetical protein
MPVDLSNVNVKHLPQESLFYEIIAYEIKPDVVTKRTPSTQKVVLGLLAATGAQKYRVDCIEEGSQFTLKFLYSPHKCDPSWQGKSTSPN